MVSSRNEPGSPAGGFGALAMMRSLERMLAADQGRPSDRAQRLFYDAMEADTADEEFALLQEALKADPGNVDALLAVLRHRPVAPEDEIELLRKIVALGERRLGPKAFEEFEGNFWGFIETRPYMRARQQLADALRCAGRLGEAIAEWEAMLELNPGDNQGVRYLLLPCYVALNRLDGAARLFGAYDECEWSTVFAWCRVLERLLNGDERGAQEALAAARKQNAHTVSYLTGRKRLPKNLPDAYAPGSREEAVCFVDVLRPAWSAHPKARAWLLKNSRHS